MSEGKIHQGRMTLQFDDGLYVDELYIKILAFYELFGVYPEIEMMNVFDMTLYSSDEDIRLLMEIPHEPKQAFENEFGDMKYTVRFFWPEEG